MNEFDLVSHIDLFFPGTVVLQANSKDKDLSVGFTYYHG